MTIDQNQLDSLDIDEPGHMRVLILDEVGGVFRDAVVPRASPKPREVLVRIHASGVNPLDSKIRLGMAPHARHPLPNVLGMDMAGVVVAVGNEAKGFRVGDEVYGLVGGVGGRQGTLAEFVAVETDLLAHKPSNLSMRQAAALPLVLITAWEGLVDRARVMSGQKVLVHGGAGGVFVRRSGQPDAGGGDRADHRRHFGAEIRLSRKKGATRRPPRHVRRRCPSGRAARRAYASRCATPAITGSVIKVRNKKINNKSNSVTGILLPSNKAPTSDI